MVKLEDSDGQVVYIDPWTDVMKDREYEKADTIISTHDHFDHFDKKAIQQLEKSDTVLVCTEESEDEVPEDLSYKVIEPGKSIDASGVKVKGVHAYNVDKFRESGDPYHPKGFCTGVILELDGLNFYHASDTDPIREMEKLWEEDITMAFMPVGGTYTMDQEEAVIAIEMVRPERVVPIHYGHIDETTADIEKFREEVGERTETEPLILD